MVLPDAHKERDLHRSKRRERREKAFFVRCSLLVVEPRTKNQEQRTNLDMEVRSVEAIVRALNGAGVKYLVVGGLAVNAHGYVRLTQDVDLVLQLVPENTERGLNALLEAGWQLAIPVKPEDFADSATRECWRVEKHMIVLKLWSDVHRRTPIDIFIYEPFDFSKEFARARHLEVAAGVLAPVVSLDTLISMKKSAGRPLDLIDIQELERGR
jgi:hypothetical protein